MVGTVISSMIFRCSKRIRHVQEFSSSRFDTPEDGEAVIEKITITEWRKISLPSFSFSQQFLLTSFDKYRKLAEMKMAQIPTAARIKPFFWTFAKSGLSDFFDVPPCCCQLVIRFDSQTWLHKPLNLCFRKLGIEDVQFVLDPLWR